MKNTLSIIGLSLLSAVIGAVATVYIIGGSAKGGVQVVEKVVERTPAFSFAWRILLYYGGVVCVFGFRARCASTRVRARLRRV